VRKERKIVIRPFLGQPFNLADQEEGSGSAAMQGKESPVGSNTQETHQYVGPYRLEKTLGKGQTGGWMHALSLSLPPPSPSSLLSPTFSPFYYKSPLLYYKSLLRSMIAQECLMLSTREVIYEIWYTSFSMTELRNQCFTFLIRKTKRLKLIDTSLPRNSCGP